MASASTAVLARLLLSVRSTGTKGEDSNNGVSVELVPPGPRVEHDPPMETLGGERDTSRGPTVLVLFGGVLFRLSADSSRVCWMAVSIEPVRVVDSPLQGHEVWSACRKGGDSGRIP